MKNTYFYLLLVLILNSCTEPKQEVIPGQKKVPLQVEQSITKRDTVILIKEDTMLKSELAKYHIRLTYESLSSKQISNETFKVFFAWILKTQEELELRKEGSADTKRNIIFEIEAIVNKKITAQTASKRIEDVVEIINSSIGIDQDDIPIVKSMYYFKQGDLGDNYINISLNQLVL